MAVKKYKVVWSDFAIQQLDTIFDYYLENANYKVARKLVRNILLETEKLINNQELGQEEELLKVKDKKFRYLLYKNYKIIYFDDKLELLIKVYDVFDTRQNPIKLKRNK